MVAAATISLPERAEAGRNYDYRYVWIRDQCYAGPGRRRRRRRSPARRRRLLRRRSDARPTATDWHPPTPSTAARYRTSSMCSCPVIRVGTTSSGTGSTRSFNSTRTGRPCCCSPRRPDTTGSTRTTGAPPVSQPRRSRNAGREPDAGIWELDNRPWTQSRLTAAAGLRAIAAATHGEGGAADWLTLADRIVADTAARAVHPDGHWQRAPDDPHLDASLLLAGLRGATAPDDPRAVKHLRRVPARADRRRLRLPLPARRPSAPRGRRLVPALRLPRLAHPPSVRKRGGRPKLV